MKFTIGLLLGTLVLGAAGAAHGDEANHRKLSAVPFTAVRLHDAFWAPRLATNREKSLPHNFQWCEQTGRIDNFAKAAGQMEGRFKGLFFNDSDVYKLLEGASYSLADHPDPALEKQVDEVIAKIAAAQQKDGYLNTYFTLVEPTKRWTDIRGKHEMYCAGHLFEAAVAHYRATGKRTLLDVAIKLADHLDRTFGPERRHEVPGHEEVELALVKLSEACGEPRYFELAKFMIDIRGDKAQRSKLFGPYHQDHQPVREQREIVGHAVRAMYLYCGVADVAARTGGDCPNFRGHHAERGRENGTVPFSSGDQALIEAMQRIWQSVAERKMYITGGIGARHAGEAFGDDYELPNESAYCETCAAIGLALWAHRLNLLEGDARYADVLERAAYNGILSGIALDGRQFFYVNPLASNGKHHRQPFFDCACCPTNVVRFVPSIPGYVLATGDDAIYVNLYAACNATVTFGGRTVKLTQKTRYPWEGKVKITLAMDAPAQFALALRMPEWCETSAARDGTPGVAVNGRPEEKLDFRKGYAVLQRQWKLGDSVELDLPIQIRRLRAHPSVQADAGRVALQRGPIVYCFEAVDNGGEVKNIVLPRDAKFTAEHRPDLLGGVTVVRGVDRDGRPILAVPYYSWDHRAPGEMAVWVCQDGMPDPAPDAAAWRGKLYRPLD